MKKLYIIVPVIVLAIATFLFFRGKNAKSETKYVTADVQRGDISITVTATGNLQAVTTVQVGSQVSGTISALYADFNGRVKKGQILAQLDPAPLKAQVLQAEADLERSVASAKLARSDSARSISLFDRNLISESDKETSITNFELAQAAVKSSQANLDRLKTNLEYATITSPIDGVVISRNVDVGQTVAASLSAPTIFTIAQDLTQMQVLASIDESDIGKIKEGQDVAFTVDAYPDQMFKGTVQQVRLSPEVVQNVVSYDVIIAVSNPDLLLKPGMTANVTVLIDQRQDVLKVPAGALRFRPSGMRKGTGAGQGGSSQYAGVSQSGQSGRSQNQMSANANLQGGGSNQAASDPATGFRKPNHNMIWKLNSSGKPMPIPVQVGITDGSFTEVNSDSLQEGDKVITSQVGAPTPTASQEVNPFMPRFGGGGGGRR